MTLNEAIKHAEEAAEDQEELYRLCPASESEFSHCDGTKDCKAVKNGKNKGCQKCAKEHRQLAEWLKELKQLREQTKWTSVSEGLPKEFEFVNCTCRSLVDDREDWVIETVYIPQLSDSPYSDWGNIPMLNVGECEVVAWMHRDIPEPYKAEREDK